MPPRPRFPNPEHLRSTKGAIGDTGATRLREFIPGDRPEGASKHHLIRPDVRQPTEEERAMLVRVEQAVDSMFFAAGLTNVPTISPDAMHIFTPSADAQRHGYVGPFFDVGIVTLDSNAPDGARKFLHAAAHEFIHAKGKNLWTVGVNTTNRTSGFARGLGRMTMFPNNLRAPEMVRNVFVGLNEAFVETLTLFACENLLRSEWFLRTFKTQEAQTATIRREAREKLLIPDEAISSISLDTGETAQGYLAEQRILAVIFRRIADAAHLPKSHVLLLFEKDYVNGSMKRITPLLRHTFGPDILRVLAVWSPNTSQETLTLLYDYLHETSPAARAAFAQKLLVALPC